MERDRLQVLRMIGKKDRLVNQGHIPVAGRGFTIGFRSLPSLVSVNPQTSIVPRVGFALKKNGAVTVDRPAILIDHEPCASEP